MERTLGQGGLKSNQLNSKSNTANYATHDTCATRASTRASDRASTRASTRASLLVVDQLLVTQRVAPDHSYHSHCLLRSFPQRVA